MRTSATQTSSAGSRRATAGRLALALAFASGLFAACFSPPSDDVLFACEPDGDDRCPPDYRCEADGCCHRIGTDVDASFGDCALGGNSGGPGPTDATGEAGEAGETGETEETGDSDEPSGTETAGSENSG
jgi:hypothetical protein